MNEHDGTKTGRRKRFQTQANTLDENSKSTGMSGTIYTILPSHLGLKPAPILTFPQERDFLEAVLLH